MHLPFLITATLGFGFTLLLAPLALRLGHNIPWLQRPADWHHGPTRPVPRLGGSVLVVVFLGIEFIGELYMPQAPPGARGHGAMVIGSLAVFGLGFCDDIRPLSPGRKLLGQILIALAVCYSGFRLETCRQPLTNATLQLGNWGLILSIVWLVTLTNLINLVDGLDGLAGGICLMLMLLSGVVAVQSGHFGPLAFGMAGALAGFLCFNLPPARLYLGDGGAYFLGFQVGLYSIDNSNRGANFGALIAPVFILALPAADALLAVLRRGLVGLPLFRPDRKHLHHRLLSEGFSQRKVVLLVYALDAVLLCMGLAAYWSAGERLPQLAGAAVLLLFACAGSFAFSRRWFAVHRIVRSSLGMRPQIRYALSLVYWLEQESRRRSGPEELWPDFVFAAEKLGFDSLKLSLANGDRIWQRHDRMLASARCHYDCPNGHYGRLEFTAPACPFNGGNHKKVVECKPACEMHSRGCAADPKVFEATSELLAEAWNCAAARWNGQQLLSNYEKNCNGNSCLLVWNRTDGARVCRNQ